MVHMSLDRATEIGSSSSRSRWGDTVLPRLLSAAEVWGCSSPAASSSELYIYLYVVYTYIYIICTYISIYYNIMYVYIYIYMI